MRSRTAAKWTVVTIIAAGCTFVLVNFHRHRQEDVRVKRLAIEQADRDKVGQYLIFTDKGVFRNGDSYIHLKTDSADIQGKLAKGKCYRFTAYGWRLRIFSWYQNIVKAKEIQCP